MENADDGEESETETIVTGLQDEIPVKEGVHQEPPSREKVTKEPTALPRMTAANAWTAWLTEIDHLQSMSIEDVAAYMRKGLDSPSKAVSQNHHDLARWSEERPSPSKARFQIQQDLAKWSEEREMTTGLLQATGATEIPYVKNEQMKSSKTPSDNQRDLSKWSEQREETTELPEVTELTKVPLRDPWATLLAEIRHLQSIPIEDVPAYLERSLPSSYKARSQNNLDLSQWSEERPSPSKARFQTQHDLVKWSEEPDKEEDDDAEFGAFWVESFEVDSDKNLSTKRPLNHISPDILEQIQLPKAKVNILDQSRIPYEVNDRERHTISNSSLGKEGYAHIYNPQHAIPEEGNDRTKLGGESTKAMVAEGFTIVAGGNSGRDDDSIEATLEHSHAAHTKANAKSKEMDHARSTEAINIALGANDSGQTVALTGGPIATISGESEHGSDVVRDIDECLNQIRALAAPFASCTLRPSPFKRSQ